MLELDSANNLGRWIQIRAGKFCRVVGWNVIWVVVVAALSEIVFGTWLTPSGMDTLDIPRQVERHFDTTNLYKGGGPSVYTRDQYGLRGNYGDAPAEIDILVVGGSTTNEYYISDQDTWTARLQQLFWKSGQEIRFANAGVDGQSTRGHIHAFRHWFPNIPGLSPSHVIAYVGINDIKLDHRVRQDTMVPASWVARNVQYAMNQSALYRAWQIVSGYVRAQRMRLIHEIDGSLKGREWVQTSWPDLGAVRSQHANLLHAYEGRVQELDRLIRAFGAMPVFVTQRLNYHRVRDGKLFGIRTASTHTYAQHAVWNERTLATCQKLKAICIDLAGILRFEDGDFYDYVHTTPIGSAKIANFLFSALSHKFDLIFTQGNRS